MSNRRKVWFAPMAALALVLMLVAVVFAAAPVKGPQIDDQSITIGATSATATVDLADVDGNGTDAVTDADTGDDGTLAYTVATSNERVAGVSLATTDTSAIVTNWWDRLGGLADDGSGSPNTNGTDPDTSCTKRANALGFTAGAGIRGDIPDDANPNRAGLPETSTGAGDAVQATGFCQDFTDLTTDGDDPRTEEEETAFDLDGVIIDAFHWDMLTGPEMIAVARAAGEANPSAYGAAFGGLTLAQQAKVAGWFDGDFMARGTASTLTLTNDGIDSDTTNNDLPGATTPDGKAGTATIYVKASDFEGRFLANSVGQSFEVTASLTPTGDIVAFSGDAGNTVPASAGAAPTGTFVTATGVTGASTGVSHVAAVPASELPQRFDLTIGTDAEGAIARVHAQAGADLQQHHQKIEFILRGDSRFQISRASRALQAADITLTSGATLVRDEEIDLTLQVNELGNVGANNEIVALRVLVVEGGVAPMLDTAGLDAHFAASPVKVREHAAGDEDVATDGLPVDLSGFVSHAGGQAITFEITSSDGNNDPLTVGRNSGEVTLRDPSTGATYSTDEDATNTITYTVTATDGTRTVEYEFSVEIVTNKPVPNDGDDRVTKTTETDDDGVETTTYSAEIVKGTADNGVPQDDTDVTVVDLAGLLMPVHRVPDLTFGGDLPYPLGIDDNLLKLRTVPDARPDYMLTYDDVVITIDDGFADVTDDDGDKIPDATITLNVTIHVAEPPTVGAVQMDVGVAENWTGSLAGTADLYTLPSGSSATPYYHYISGTGSAKIDETTGMSDFSVDTSDGAVELDVEQDFEDGVNRHTLTIFVRDGDEIGPLLAVITITVDETDVNEAPTFASATASGWVSENAVIDSAVKMSSAMDAADFTPMAEDQDGDTLTYSVDNALFGIAGGKLVVKGALDADSGVTSHDVVITASDGSLSATQTVTVSVGNANDDPEFVDPASTDTVVPIESATAEIDETMGNRADVNDHGTEAGRIVESFKVIDNDGAANTLVFELDEGVSDNLFEIKNVARSSTDATVWTGEVWTKAGPALDYEGTGSYPYNVNTGYTVLVEVNDGQQGDDTLTIHVTLNNLNDNAPVINASAPRNVSVDENTARGTALGDYSATDADGDTVTYSVDSDSFSISDGGMLMTLESLDADNAKTPCGSSGCALKVVASDGGNGGTTQDVTVTVNNADDSVSGFTISKANPIANISSDGDDAMTALADAKTTASAKVPESPADLPATVGDAPAGFVSADWGNWGTVLRIEVTSPSPDPDCGNGNQCVFLSLDADSSDESIRLEAYRSSTQENLFIAAVMLVKREDGGTDGAVVPVYKHSDGSVARLIVDEEDDVEVRLIEKDAAGQFVDSKVAPTNVDVENEKPEFTNFAPEHEAAFDDGDVEYTFTITDAVSGVPEPEDLPDTNGDSDYMPVVALVSGGQCQLEDPNDKKYSSYDFAGNTVWCESKPGIWAITDDRDFDEIDDGFEVDTKIVLDENEHHYVTFIACDAAGNCALYTPDSNEIEEAFAQITVDTKDPVLFEARTGIMWDATDEELDKNNPTWIQVIFKDLSVIDEDSVEADDFVVKGHTVKDAKRYGDDADGDDQGDNTLRMIFLELEDELAPDEEPNVSVVPNGIMDKAGNEQDDGDEDAKDYIAPSFTVVSIVSPRTPDAGMDAQLAGEDDEVVITLTSDERIQETRPSVTVTHVNAPAGKVFTAVKRETCDDEGTDDGYRVRGEIANTDDCQDADAATGGELGKTIAKVSNTEWTITVKEPDATGYYNIYVEGTDRSGQKNKGDEGIAPDDLVTDFFERDGDVNTGDAHFFQGDRNLANPAVWVSGERIEDTEPAVEFKTPLFVELNFTEAYLSDCQGEEPGSDDHKAKCFAESDEYAKDSFDSVTITSFTLNGTDITEMVKTTDDETFLVSIDGIAIGDHEIEIQAVDQAGNDLAKTLSVEFEVEERDDFSQRLNPGWNLVSIPGEPADSDISVVFGSDMQVRTVYTYNPIIPGGWMVAVRESADSEWQGDLKEITARQGYWVLSDAIQDWDVSIPRLAGGAVGSGTPIQPPVIALYAGWNLVPVIDVTGDFAGDGISAQAYLQSLDDGLDLARVLGFDTITNTWSTVMAPESGDSETLAFGKAYWVFVRQAASLVPGN